MLEHKDHPGQSKWHAYAIIFLGGFLARLLYKIRIHGATNVPLQDSLMVLSKHQRFADIPLGTYALWSESKRHPWAIMKDSLAGPIFRKFFQRCGGIPINRKNPEKSKSQFAFAKEVLLQKQILTVFPEQTLYPGKMGKGKEGGFKLITGNLQESLAVICVGFRYQKLLFRTQVDIHIGTVKNLLAGENVSAFFVERMQEIAELSAMQYMH
ncbi:MAG: lysophospholipid acyltransferase family protein [Spirochaetota bacterium]